MPPIKTTVSCPQCRTPVPVTLEQLFDVGQDPAAKQRFLSQRFNLISCPNCRYTGQAATILMYHDPDKEILMSYAPMELGLPQPEQERVIGKLMNEVINRLPQEKRKGYLLNPRPALTMQGLMDRILEADGITKEMLDSQRAKVQLAQTFMNTPPDQLPELVKQHDAEMDEAFFQLLSVSIQAASASGEEVTARRAAELQNQLLPLTTFGRQYLERQKKAQAAVRTLQELGDSLTKDKLLDLIITADDDDTALAYVSLMRPAIDYAFFEALTRRIDRSEATAKQALTARRDRILELTQAMDEAARAQMLEAADLLRSILNAPDLDKAVRDNLGGIDDVFMAVLNDNLEAARKANRLDVAAKLSQIGNLINQLARESAPPEVRLVNELLDQPTDAEAEALLRKRAGEINPQFMSALTYISESLRQNGQTPLADRLDKLHSQAIGEQMAANWKK